MFAGGGQGTGAGGRGRARWRCRGLGQNESCKLQPTVLRAQGGGNGLRPEAGGFMAAGEEIPPQSRKDSGVPLPDLPAPRFGTCQPGPQSPGQPPCLPCAWFGGVSALPPRRAPPWMVLVGSPGARLFLKVNSLSLSLSWSFQSRGRVRKMTDFFPPSLAWFAGKVTPASDVSGAGRRPHCLGCSMGGL